MHHEIHIDIALNRAIVKTGGEATVDGFRATVNALTSHADWKPGMDVLVDHSELLIGTAGTEEVRQLSKIAQELDHLTGDGRCAMVMTETVAFGLARMFQIIAGERISQTMLVFSTREEAEAWLDGKQEQG